MRALFAMILFLSLCCAGCKQDEKSLQEELAEIDSYIQDNGLNMMETSSGLHYMQIENGSGSSSPTIDSEVTVDYIGELMDGTIFDQNPNWKAPLAGLIQGWQEGIQLMNKGDRYLLIFPSTLGYGSQGTGSIPGYSPLVFDITLRDF